MAQTVKVGESGKNLYVYTGFDMSGATRLELRWQKPSGGVMVRDSSAGQVSTSSVAVFVTALSATLTANEYAIYTIGTGSAGEIDEKGDWKIWLTYEVSTDTPITRLLTSAFDAAGNPVVMTVTAGRTSAAVVDAEGSSA